MVSVRWLAEADLERVEDGMPLWSRREYRRRLSAQLVGHLVQVVAWDDAGVPVGRGMVLFPGHPEWSTSAERERCAEVRDVEVVEGRRRRGIGRSVMAELEAAARGQRASRIGLTVGTGEDARAARALYGALGYRRAHGPFVSSATLVTDEGPRPVFVVAVYLTKSLLGSTVA